MYIFIYVYIYICIYICEVGKVPDLLSKAYPPHTRSFLSPVCQPIETRPHIDQACVPLRMHVLAHECLLARRPAFPIAPCAPSVPRKV